MFFVNLTVIPKQVVYPRLSISDNHLCQDVFEFAKKAHTGQLRKYTEDPYILHPLSVAEIAYQAYPDKNVVAAGLLHDTVEDTDVTLEEVEYNFGWLIARLVSDLTDVSQPEDGNRKQRKAIDRQHTAQASPLAKLAKLVKLADLWHNTSSIVQYDIAFAKTYLKEKVLLLEGALLDVSPGETDELKTGFHNLRSQVWKSLNEGEHALVQDRLQKMEENQ